MEAKKEAVTAADLFFQLETASLLVSYTREGNFIYVATSTEIKPTE